MFLSVKLHNVEFDILDFNIREKVNSIIHKKFISQKQKLKQLLLKKNKKPEQNQNLGQTFSFFDRFVNLTNTHFSPDEENLLKKGFNYNLHTTVVCKL